MPPTFIPATPSSQPRITRARFACQLIGRVVDEAGRLKVLDFGLAKTAQSTMLTKTGSTLGTAAYMSPEQCWASELTDASDQVSAVKSVMRELRVHETTMQPSAVLSRISLAKNRMESLDHDDLLENAMRRYQEHLRRAHMLDFDDLLIEAVRLFEQAPGVRQLDTLVEAKVDPGLVWQHVAVALTHLLRAQAIGRRTITKAHDLGGIGVDLEDDLATLRDLGRL